MIFNISVELLSYRKLYRIEIKRSLQRKGNKPEKIKKSQKYDKLKEDALLLKQETSEATEKGSY